ncbi:hypothetical protein [Rhodanobacter sp. T12-5]|uniref:hypothetical protein n=1 Tax=Rhodanobacter sp. T12-5 TaxID=2024611 RepID=UPI0011EF6FC1|nr:hypothetical protein [Rhodanobacter sp. T12-5]KAA0068598.1 hypothetical protein CIW53_15030 [Rhodanobacter sp. T12-5]
MNPQLFFSDYFEIQPGVLQKFGTLNICVEADLPLFIDPFLLFASSKPEYKSLHKRIVGHLLELKGVALSTSSPNEELFKFPEVKQNWLGVCKWGNNGRGLGPKFAKSLIRAFRGFYRNFGEEDILESSHIEKLTLVGSGIGRDFISDFTANLALEYLLEYTERFAKKYLKPYQRARFSVRCSYDAELKVWQPRSFELPYFYRDGYSGDFIVLTPLDILSKDEAFISHSSFVSQFRSVTNSLDNTTLRNSINEFFASKLPANPKRDEVEYAIDKTVERFPEILDYYIHHQEKNKDRASAISAEKVEKFKSEIIETIGQLVRALFKESEFYRTPTTSYGEALARAKFLKDVIENNDGYRVFYKDGKPIAQEESVQRIFRLTWFSSPYDVNAEVNNGRGPADYKISFGERDSTIVEFKLGGSSSLERNLKNQAAIYKKASKAITDIAVILCYTRPEIARVGRVLRKLKIEDAENIIVIDASPKVSASKA